MHSFTVRWQNLVSEQQPGQSGSEIHLLGDELAANPSMTWSIRVAYSWRTQDTRYVVRAPEMPLPGGLELSLTTPHVVSLGIAPATVDSCRQRPLDSRWKLDRSAQKWDVLWVSLGGCSVT